MAKSRLVLKDFLMRHCRIKPSPAVAGDEEYYELNTEESRYYMTQSHLREMLRAVGQSIESATASSKKSDEPGVITAHMRKSSVAMIEHIRIPVKLVDGLGEKQAFQLLRHLEGIQKDIDDGKTYLARLEDLFRDTAKIKIVATPEGERVYEIIGQLSASDHRRYVERYAEHVASSTLFDVAKALNARLATYVPEESREKFFVEGRDLSDRKMRFGEEVATELVLTDEGAWMYTTIASNNPQMRDTVSTLFQKAMLDPFGLSLTHYMGKHNVLKAGKRPLAKVPPLSAFPGWLKGLFGRSVKAEKKEE